MQSARPRIAEAALGLGIIVLLAFLVVPWKQRELPRPPAAGGSPSAAAPAGLPASSSPASPDSILPIFIGRAASVSAPAAKPPVDATWLQYLGHSSAPDGSVTWFVKDTRTGKVIRAGKTEGADGWAVVEEKDASLLLKSAGVLYAVVKR